MEIIMARKTQISKEVILEAAFQKLIRDGYASINIHSLAKEIGCSTQPIAWHFDNMDGLRKELFYYSVRYVKDLYKRENESTTAFYEAVALGAVTLAVEKPNLYKYLYMENQHGFDMKEVTQAVTLDNVDELIQELMQSQQMSVEQVRSYLMHLDVYIHGICDLVATGFAPFPKETVLQMVRSASDAFLMQIKAM